MQKKQSTSRRSNGEDLLRNLPHEENAPKRDKCQSSWRREAPPVSFFRQVSTHHAITVTLTSTGPRRLQNYLKHQAMLHKCQIKPGGKSKCNIDIREGRKLAIVGTMDRLNFVSSQYATSGKSKLKKLTFAKVEH